jgi:hypothetical protein
MNSILRLAAGAGTCILVLGGLTLYQAETDSCENPPAASVDKEDSLNFEIERSAILDEQLARMRHIIAVKQHIARELIVGRVTLGDAGARFHELEKMTPGANHRVFQAAYPGATDPERYCRQVIDRAVQMNASDPLDHEALRSRLETELKRQFCGAPLTATD